MKKKILRLSVLLLVITVVLGMSGIIAYAEEAQYVYDPAYLLSDEEYYELNELAANVSEKYGCAVHFVTDDNPALNLDNIQIYSEDLYLESPALGYGESKDGVMLVLGTYERCYWLLAYGPYGNYAFTDYGKDWMSNNFIQHFPDDNWYDGFRTYITDCEYMLSCAAAGEPVDIIEDIGTEGYGMAGIAGIISAFITCGVFKRKMRTVYSATEASQYMDAANVQILHRSDIFTYQDVERRKRSSDDNKSSGGTTVNSRGFSGKGGSF
jgi:uncharacterized membrane protein YgcG